MVFSIHTSQPREHTRTKRKMKYQRHYLLLFLKKVEKRNALEIKAVTVKRLNV